MTIQHLVGYIGMGWAAVMAAAVTDNLAIAGGVLLILVAISTLMIQNIYYQSVCEIFTFS